MNHVDMLKRIEVANKLLANDMSILPQSINQFLSNLIKDLGAHYVKTTKDYENYDKLV